MAPPTNPLASLLAMPTGAGRYIIARADFRRSDFVGDKVRDGPRNVGLFAIQPPDAALAREHFIGLALLRSHTPSCGLSATLRTACPQTCARPTTALAASCSQHAEAWACALSPSLAACGERVDCLCAC